MAIHRFEIVLAVIVTIAVAGFLCFVYGFPLLFPYIDAARPGRFETRVAEVSATGDFERANVIARHAVKTFPFDPMAHTVFGQSLLRLGKDSEGIQQLKRATGLTRFPEGGETRKPFYFAPARLALGQQLEHEDQTSSAVLNFELARPYWDSFGPHVKQYASSLFTTYAGNNLWRRALEFGRPTPNELGTLATSDVQDIALLSLHRRNFELAREACNELTSRGVADMASFILGRIDLQKEAYEEALPALEAAYSVGLADAAFFYGAALEHLGQFPDAITAYAQTPRDSHYAVFAYVKALALLRTNLMSDATETSTNEEELQNSIDAIVSELKLLPPPRNFDKYARTQPIAVRTNELAAGLYSILVLWQSAGVTNELESPTTAVRPGWVESLQVSAGDGLYLTLDFSENMLFWDSIENTSFAELPGWIDTARDWFNLRESYTPHIQREGEQSPCLVIPRMTWFYSVPLQVRSDSSYLLGGSMHSPSGKGDIGWQAIDDNEKVLAYGSILEEPPANEWVSDVGYLRPLPHWDHIRVQLNVSPRAGRVAFDDITVLETHPPDLVAPALSDLTNNSQPTDLGGVR